MKARQREPEWPELPDSASEPDLSQQPGAPWSVRVTHGPELRPALEIHEGGTFVDVVVVTPLVTQILRGVRQSVSDGHPRVIAWGRLPSDDSDITVTFSRRRLPGLRVTQHIGALTKICGSFWLATACGQFSNVVVTYQGNRQQRRIGKGYRC
jgi:hypothetical protein